MPARKNTGGRPGAARDAKVTFHPATPERWGDLETLFGPKGACAGCWCMYWRMRRSEWEARRGAGNRRALRRLVESPVPPGVLAYAGDVPIGWCAIAPRGDYSALERSRILKPVDDEPVWSITCFFVTRAWRRRGVTARLVGAACDLARAHGARIVEGYPVEPRSAEGADVFMFTGLASSFLRAGFREVARRSPTRPIMRRMLTARGGRSAKAARE